MRRGRKAEHLRRLRSNAGFTLIELIVGIAVFGIMLAVVTVVFDRVSQQYRQVHKQGDLDVILDETAHYIQGRLSGAASIYLDTKNTDNMKVTIQLPIQAACGLLVFDRKSGGIYDVPIIAGIPGQTELQLQLDEWLTTDNLIFDEDFFGEWRVRAACHRLFNAELPETDEKTQSRYLDFTLSAVDRDAHAMRTKRYVFALLDPTAYVNASTEDYAIPYAEESEQNRYLLITYSKFT